MVFEFFEINMNSAADMWALWMIIDAILWIAAVIFFSTGNYIVGAVFLGADVMTWILFERSRKEKENKNDRAEVPSKK